MSVSENWYIIGWFYIHTQLNIQVFPIPSAGNKFPAILRPKKRMKNPVNYLISCFLWWKLNALDGLLYTPMQTFLFACIHPFDILTHKIFSGGFSGNGTIFLRSFSVNQNPARSSCFFLFFLINLQRDWGKWYILSAEPSLCHVSNKNVTSNNWICLRKNLPLTFL